MRGVASVEFGVKEIWLDLELTGCGVDYGGIKAVLKLDEGSVGDLTEQQQKEESESLPDARPPQCSRVCHAFQHLPRECVATTGCVGDSMGGSLHSVGQTIGRRIVKA